jgi:hypothetical protein
MNHHETATPAISNKKKIRKEIVEKLTGALADYKQELGEKKLATRVKKASKLISRDLEKLSKKHKQRTKKSAVKATKGTKAVKAPKPARKVVKQEAENN